MSRLSDAYAAHAKLDVPGVTMYDLDTIPSAVQAMAKAPCCFPIFQLDSTYSSPHDIDHGDQEHTAVFLLLISPAEGVPGAFAITPKAVELIDGYLAALAQNPDLRTDPDDIETDTITNRGEVAVSARPRNVNGNWWYAAEITHTWRVHVEEDI